MQQREKVRAISGVTKAAAERGQKVVGDGFWRRRSAVVDEEDDPEVLR